MLYLFAGESRKADVRHYLEEFCDLAQVGLEISEMDICRDPSMDLLDEAIAKRALQQIRDGSWDVVIVTPPCNTFSRVRFVQPGPKPVRSRLYPLGFPWLSDNLLELGRQGNQFIDFSLQVCFATLDVRADFLLEHPEDLGRTRSGHTPASIWQLEGAQRLFSHERVFTFAVYQCKFLAKSPKPTRFMTTIQAAKNMPFSGPPKFGEDDRYAGPLPQFCGHFPQEGLAALREDWFDMLPDPLRARDLIPHQPFYLNRLWRFWKILISVSWRKEILFLQWRGGRPSGTSWT